MILRYSKKYPPVPLSGTVMSYNDTDTKDRITHKESLRVAMNRILEKHNPDAVKVSVVILSYNHENYIAEAIESVLSQRGAFLCEILLSDDGSTDRTPEIMAEYAAKYPTLIRNISSTENVGISRNYKRCFQQATGKYVAVLEGDDYWKASDKLLRQMEFLQANPDCSMVFSRIAIIDEAGTRMELKRQQYIYRTKLTGYDFLADRFLNLIVNFLLLYVYYQIHAAIAGYSVLSAAFGNSAGILFGAEGACRLYPSDRQRLPKDFNERLARRNE